MNDDLFPSLRARALVPFGSQSSVQELVLDGNPFSDIRPAIGSMSSMTLHLSVNFTETQGVLKAFSISFSKA